MESEMNADLLAGLPPWFRAWKLIDGKKPPVGPDGQPLPNWQEPPYLSLAEARALAAEVGGGIGFVLGEGYAALDVDGCFDADGRPVSEAASLVVDVIRTVRCYSDKTPSMRGMRALFRGPRSLEISFKTDPPTTNSLGLFVTLTGVHAQGDPNLQAPGLVDAVIRCLGDAVPATTEPKKAEPIPETVRAGTQNTTLFREGCRLRRIGWKEDEIAAALWGLVESGRVPSEPGKAPWPRGDVAAIARSCARYDPNTALSPSEPMQVARYVQATFAPEGLVYQADSFYRWERTTNSWPEVEDSALRSAVWKALESAVKVDEKGKPVPYKPNARGVSEVLDALKAITHVPGSQKPPCYLDGRESDGLIPFRNGLLRFSDRTLLPPDPTFYNHTALPFDYDPAAQVPFMWEAFLGSLWCVPGQCDDPEAVPTLQEMFGYMVSGETRFQKIFLLVGPKRSGKGTIGRVLTRLLGKENVSTPSLSALGETFGRECLIGKSAAVFSDARLASRSNVAAVVEELLAVSGEDGRSVARKYKKAWEGRLPVRFVMLTNELPRLEDASGALASRFVTLKMTRSFIGREFKELEDHLVPGLPGIVNWALDGWARLKERGHFVTPESSEELVEEFENLGSPISSFLKDECEIGTGFDVGRSELWAAWKTWCERTGRLNIGTTSTFLRDLRAALPSLSEKRKGPRGGQHRVLSGIGLLRPEDQGDVPF
jgi:putative DNA primase/helicase